MNVKRKMTLFDNRIVTHPESAQQEVTLSGIAVSPSPVTD
jgi:hypothetical protein